MAEHVTDFYADGFTLVEYCKNCSAEGEALREPCKPLIYSGAIIFQNMTKAEFEEKYQKALDQSKPKR